jgi:hypothetical protein
MKYLVNRETKEHKVATPLAESIIKGYPDFKDDWQLVEADSEGWIPWSGGECPLPESKLAEVRLQDGQQGRFESIDLLTHRSWQKWNCGGDIIAYRPILAEQEPDNHLGEDTTRRINEGIRRRFDEARHSLWSAQRNEDEFMRERGPAQAEGTPSVFDRLKSAVAASESIPTLLAEIDALLPDGYCVTRCVEQPAEDMTDWRNWKEGDILECIRPTEFHTKGRLYLIGTDSEGDYGILDDEGDVLDRYAPGGECFTRSYFRFHSRPAKETDNANN